MFRQFVPFIRCSAAFFEEERAALDARRTKIRLLQQRKMSELQTFKDLPDEIPMHLVIGTKVTGDGSLKHSDIARKV